ncbi:MAG: type II toxin-antitoxin system prevent-host-death family antitoxin [Gemmatimonadetes bacterium]|nr:type II toxin-antitoxin system prevent-host-death family antitoxin [Gemmatimonadota bacterium]
MRKTSISILKAHLSRYLDAVKAGEEVIVTERGRPVARLTGVLDLDAPTARVAQLVREGRMRAPMDAAPADAQKGGLPPDPEGRALRHLLDERSEGR